MNNKNENLSTFLESTVVAFNGSKQWAIKQPPVDWKLNKSGIWLNVIKTNQIPQYGWKVHVSSTLSDAPHVIKIVSEIAYHFDCSFKYLWGKESFITLHFKNANRLQSGKFIALYPTNEQLARKLMERLNEALTDFNGIDILSDRAYKKSSNVFYRWGAFKQTGRINSNGEPEELIPNGNGELVPDLRTSQFILPDGIYDPFNNASANPLPPTPPGSIDFDQFQIKSVLRFSNAGGRYKAICKFTNSDIVIKEARPHTGFVGEESAVPRLHREAQYLRKLNNELPGLAPELVKEFVVQDHHFIAIEYLAGTPLSDWIARENPLYSSAHNSTKLVDEYLDKVTLILNKLRIDLEKLHNIGIAFGDLSPSNIIMNDEDEPFLIDFEACVSKDNMSPGVGTPDFCLLEQGGTLSAQHRDIYAFNCIAISFILRLTTLAEISNHALKLLTKELSNYTSKIPQWWFDACEHVRLVSQGHSQYKSADCELAIFNNSSERERLREKFVSAILENSTPDNIYLFPTSNKSSKGAFLCFSHGDTGVLSILQKHSSYLNDELIFKYEKSVETALDKGLLPLGYDFGLAGILDTCNSLGLKYISGRIVEEIVKKWDQVEDPSLASGLTGIALTLARHNYVLLAEEILEKAIKLGLKYRWNKNGLLYGRSGVIAGVCQFESLLSSKPVLSKLVCQLISDEFSQTVRHPIGNSLSLRAEVDGNRLLPYLRDGTAGMLLALLLATDCQSLDYTLAESNLVDLAMDLGTPFMLEASLMDGAAGLAIILEIIQDKYPDLKSKIPAPRWDRIAKYLLPCGSGTGLFNPRSYKYDFSHAQGTAGILEALLWLDGLNTVNLSGLIIPPVINHSLKF